MSLLKISALVHGHSLGAGAGRLGMHSKFARAMMSVQGGATASNDEKIFYTLGVNIARQVGGELKALLTPAEREVMVKGFADSLVDKAGDEEQLLRTYGPMINEVLGGRMAVINDQQKKKGEEFITKFLLSNPRAVKTASGLVFHEIIAGLGKQPSPTSTVVVHYHGTLPDGTVFDSSVARGEPIKFPLTNVIKGWQEGVCMMRVGSKATLVVPPALGYGDAGSPPVIPPGATLQFEVELIEIA